MKELVDVHVPEAAVISVVLDNLNTHTPAALYATFYDHCGGPLVVCYSDSLR